MFHPILFIIVNALFGNVYSIEVLSTISIEMNFTSSRVCTSKRVFFSECLLFSELLLTDRGGATGGAGGRSPPYYFSGD